MTKLYNKIKPYIMLFPVMIFIIGIFLFGIILALQQSLGYFPAIGLKEVTINYYKEVFNSASFLNSLKFSFLTSIASSLIAVVIGVYLSYLLIFKKGKSIIDSSYKIPIMIPPTTVALLVLMLFSQSGWIPRILSHLGIISKMEDFPPMVFDKHGLGIILAYVWKGIPFIALVTHNILRNVQTKYSSTAANLGANRHQTFWHILLPLLMPTIISSFIIIFAFSFGAFEIPYLLGPSSPKALPVLSYIYYNSIDLAQRPYAMVVNMYITLCSFIMVGIYIISYQFIKKYNN